MTEPIKIVVTGGALSVIYWKNRDTTKDINFLTEYSDSLEKVMAAKEAAAEGTRHYPPNWVNAKMGSFINQVLGCEELVPTSIKTGIMLFSSVTLQVYVADWRYQLVNKIQRAYQLVKLDQESELSAAIERNLDDALSILYLTIHNANEGWAFWADDIRT